MPIGCVGEAGGCMDSTRIDAVDLHQGVTQTSEAGRRYSLISSGPSGTSMRTRPPSTTTG